jgi:dethiobiotin synthetase
LKKKKNRGFFITGTGTDIGKTYISALLARGLAKHAAVSYMKPIQTGCRKNRKGELLAPDFEFVNKTGIIVGSDYGLHVPYRFEPACSPHLAARLSRIHINIDVIKSCIDDICAKPEMKDGCILVEGTGGILVPIDMQQSMLHLMLALDLPVILVTTPDLGTINHTMLSLCALRSVHVKLGGMIVNNCNNTKEDFIYKDNLQVLSGVMEGLPFCEIKYNSKFSQNIADFCNELLSAES